MKLKHIEQIVEMKSHFENLVNMNMDSVFLEEEFMMAEYLEAIHFGNTEKFLMKPTQEVFVRGFNRYKDKVNTMFIFEEILSENKKTPDSTKFVENSKPKAIYEFCDFYIGKILDEKWYDKLPPNTL